MTVREYIGARYVPLFADPIEWDETSSYEPLTVVTYQGASYVSRRSVPQNIEISNTDYWILWADYNAQLEQYRREVEAYNGRISALETDLPVEAFSSESTVDDRLTAVEGYTDIITELDNRLDAVEANNWVTTARIADSNVTTAKIANGNVTTAKLANNCITHDKLQNPVIVIFGDSWTDEEVPASRWVAKLRARYPNATIKNYAKNGCHHLNSSFENMYAAFVNDDSFDKSLITHAVLVYGVNDQYTYPVSATSDEAAVIKSFYDAVTASGQIPEHVDIPWVINHSYGILTNSWSEQYSYWLRVIQLLHSQCPRLIPHESMSWFNVSEYNPANFFHLTQACQEGHFFKNMEAIIFGGELIKYPTITTHPSTPHDQFGIHADIIGSSLIYNFTWAAKNGIINGYADGIDLPVPEKIDIYLPIPCGNSSGIPDNQFAHFKVESAGTFMTTFTNTIGPTGPNIAAGSVVSCTHVVTGF